MGEIGPMTGSEATLDDDRIGDSVLTNLVQWGPVEQSEQRIADKQPIGITDEQPDTTTNADSDFAPLLRDCEQCEVSQLSDRDRVWCQGRFESRALCLLSC